MSFNIRVGRALDGHNRWYRRRDLVFSTIREAAPHILGVQEAHSFQLRELLDSLSAYGAIAGRRYAGLRGSHAPILFDRARLEPGPSGDFWLAPDPHGRKTRAWDAAVPRICTWATFADRESSGRRFVILNSHFDQAGLVARTESAKLVARKLEEFSYLPRIFTADLNADESSEALGILRRAGLRDSFRVLNPDEQALTFHGFRGRGAKSLGKIDYVLCDEGWDVEAAAIIREGREGRYPSDHFPVVADLALRPRSLGS